MSGGEKMIKTKKLLSVLLALIAVLSVFNSGMTAFADNKADNEEEANRFSVISSTGSSLSISGVTAYCTASLTATSNTSLIIKMELQKKKSGVYETIKTWTDAKAGNHLMVSHTRTINALSTYRMKTTFTAGGESTVSYSYP